jgi:hypothetical protein
VDEKSLHELEHRLERAVYRSTENFSEDDLLRYRWLLEGRARAIGMAEGAFFAALVVLVLLVLTRYTGA